MPGKKRKKSEDENSTHLPVHLNDLSKLNWAEKIVLFIYVCNFFDYFSKKNDIKKQLKDITVTDEALKIKIRCLKNLELIKNATAHPLETIDKNVENHSTLSFYAIKIREGIELNDTTIIFQLMSIEYYFKLINFKNKLDLTIFITLNKEFFSKIDARYTLFFSAAFADKCSPEVLNIEDIYVMLRDKKLIDFAWVNAICKQKIIELKNFGLIVPLPKGAAGNYRLADNYELAFLEHRNEIRAERGTQKETELDALWNFFENLPQPLSNYIKERKTLVLNASEKKTYSGSFFPRLLTLLPYLL